MIVSRGETAQSLPAMMAIPRWRFIDGNEGRMTIILKIASEEANSLGER
jgi:hypothetical protein